MAKTKCEWCGDEHICHVEMTETVSTVREVGRIGEELAYHTSRSYSRGAEC